MSRNDEAVLISYWKREVSNSKTKNIFCGKTNIFKVCYDNIIAIMQHFEIKFVTNLT